VEANRISGPNGDVQMLLLLLLLHIIKIKMSADSDVFRWNLSAVRPWFGVVLTMSSWSVSTTCPQ